MGTDYQVQAVNSIECAADVSGVRERVALLQVECETAWAHNTAMLRGLQRRRAMRDAERFWRFSDRAELVLLGVILAAANPIGECETARPPRECDQTALALGGGR